MRNADSNAAEPADIDSIISSLKQILVQDLDVALDVDEIDPDASLEHDLKIDSVAMVELIAAVESRFDFSFPDSDLVAASFSNLRALAGVVAKRVQSKT